MENFNFLGIYLITINIFSFLTAGYDKIKAKHHGWRVSEKRIFFLAFIGGALGVYAGMKIFRHKTKHRLFTIGIPVLIVFNLAVIILFMLSSSAHSV